MTTPVKATLDFEKIDDMVSSIAQAATKFQFKVAQGEMQALLTALPGAKTPLKVMNNTLVSINEGMRDGHLTRKGAAHEIELAITQFKDSIQKLSDSLSQPSKFDPEVLYKDLSKDTLKVYDKNMNQVQVQLNHSGMFTGYVPVIPITQPPLDMAKLKAAGIAADTFAGYTILKKQFVAGITLEQLHKMAPKAADPNTPREKAKKLEEEALQQFREVIESKYRNLKLVQMGGQIGWWNAYWFWFVNSSEFKLMKSCTINSTTVQSLPVKSWGFPFHR